ncbi:MAG: arginine--tRNA ligase, partial [Ignavibacteria bacterium]|nr:arginine--tRNA ligase [Ignavibacteria bacterium]
EHGDFSTNIALILSKPLKRNPKDLSSEIITYTLKYENIFSKVESAGPGFINFFINGGFYISVLEEILSQGNIFGKSLSGKGKRANIEWVSANPTGPLHAGHGRQIALGKAIANLLEWNGYEVTREYYYNDAGNQMSNLGKSVYARYMQIFEPEYPFPEDGYNGDYIIDTAKKIYQENGDKFKGSSDIEYFRDYGEKENFHRIKNTLAKFSITHDVFSNEKDLYKNGDIESLLKAFDAKGMTRKEEGAVWLKMDEEKFTKDKVIVKATGEPTYRLPDMAYHINKIKRGFDLIIDIFGADHGDTYKEVLFGVESAGYDTSKIKVIIHQMVTFKMGNESVKMSKRSDNVYYLDNLIEDVGIDATQFFFVMRAANTHLDFDIELAKEQSDKNPVFYLQYAHARISGIFRNAKDLFDISPDTNANLCILKNENEIDLIKILSKFPFEVQSAYSSLEPHRIINYLNQVAEMFHKFYHNNRVINTEERETSIARLKLCEAAQQVLKNGFSIIGINAPDKM